MLIAHISDPHIAGWGRKAYRIAPTAETLAHCIDHINRLAPKPDLAVVTGDITNGGCAEEADRAASLLGELRCPYYIIPGNHDDRSHLWSVFGGRACPARAGAFMSYVIEGHELRLIALDSTRPGAPGGEICASRASWLDQRLAEAKGRPTVIFMHHPPVECGVPETDLDGFLGADMLGDVVEKYPNIERILCGHIHLQAHVRWRGTVVSTAPSTGMRLVLDLTMARPSEFDLAAPGYQLHYWSPQRNLVTHVIQVGEAEGPYPFEERPEPVPASDGQPSGSRPAVTDHDRRRGANAAEE